jgi:transcription-repair coupling factor (superfamily II helicase)
MNSIVEYVGRLKEWLEEDQRISVSGLEGSSRAYLLSRFLLKLDRPALIILPRTGEADRLYRELAFFLPESLIEADPGERRLYRFPAYDISPLAGLSPHREVVNQRLEALYALSSEDRPVLITSLESILFRIMPKSALVDAIEMMETGDELERDSLVKKLETAGYGRTSMVEERGDYSVRGGVIDVFPPLYSEPIRLEFWGDQIESIRHFDPNSQRSTGSLKEILLLPAGEILTDRKNIDRARSMGRLPSLFGELGVFPGQEAWLNHFYDQPDTLFDYLPPKGLCLMIEPHRLDRETDRLREKIQRDREIFRQEALEKEVPFPEIQGLLLAKETLKRCLAPFRRVDISEVELAGIDAETKRLVIKSAGIGDQLDIVLEGKGRVSLVPLAEKISTWLEQKSRVVLACRTQQQAGRLTEILANYDLIVEQTVPRWDDLPAGKGLFICLGRITRGFAWPEIGLHLISEDEIFGPKRAGARRKKEGREGLSWTAFSQLKEGDLVVHQDHGIGRYGGLLKMEIEAKVNDFVLIEYAGRDRLYVPADRISVLQKYIGADEKNPKLDQLGGKAWDVVKKKAKRSIMEIAKQLVEIYALRKYRHGFGFSRPDNAFREFEASFEHEETPDQIKAIDDVLTDMEKEQPMDRLICGDVGFGKTEVAIRAAFKAVMDGKQVAMLVPTTVLAEQHYQTFRDRMGPYRVKMEVLSRFKNRAEQKDILARTRSGKVDVLIGTHRLLQKDVGFKDLGLLIIDEEQRFGVKQKERLKQYRALVDVLALTATPIPRTLHLSMMGIRDLSLIESPPEERLAIQTYLSAYDEKTVTHAIQDEIERGGQVFFVHNRVQTIHHMAGQLQKLMPEVRFGVAHGQMKEKDLEEAMILFLERELDVLVCSTIIESGLDIPSANTIVINEVDRMGLAQIYQLRGRVGRSKENAYAYLLLSKGARITREAEKRLKALMDFSHLGAGFHLAMHDLRIRGGGNILGFSQSGHIAAIGYELYLKLVEQSIAQLKGEEWQEDIDPEINLDIAAYLPEAYISDTDVRLNLYRRLSGLKEEEDLQEITLEIKDRFGPPTKEVSNLLRIMSARILMKKMGISRLDSGPGEITLTFSPRTKIPPERLINLLEGQKNRYRFVREDRLGVRLPGLDGEELLLRIKELLTELKSPQA